IVAWSLVAPLPAPAQPAAPPPAMADIRAKLAAYEKQAQASGRPDPQALAAIARLSVDRARRSTRFAEWSEACASPVEGNTAGCRAKLRAVLDNAKEPIARRAAAGAALVRRGDPEAADA